MVQVTPLLGTRLFPPIQVEVLTLQMEVMLFLIIRMEVGIQRMDSLPSIPILVEVQILRMEVTHFVRIELEIIIPQMDINPSILTFLEVVISLWGLSLSTLRHE